MVPVDLGEEAGQGVGVPGVEDRRGDRAPGVGDGRRRVGQRLGVAVAQGQAHPGPGQVQSAGAPEAPSPADQHGEPALEARPLVEVAHGVTPQTPPGYPAGTSTTTAEPMPPPAHMEATPMPPPRRRRS